MRGISGEREAQGYQDEGLEASEGVRSTPFLYVQRPTKLVSVVITNFRKPV